MTDKQKKRPGSPDCNMPSTKKQSDGDLNNLSVTDDEKVSFSQKSVDVSGEFFFQRAYRERGGTQLVIGLAQGGALLKLLC